MTGFLLVAGASVFLSTRAATNTSVVADGEKSYSETEMQLGRYSEMVVLRLYRVDDDPQPINRLRRVARPLLAATERAQIEYSFHVLDTKDKTAISLPNGRILFTRGLLEMVDKDDELAAIIAHEFAHINHKHAIQTLEHFEQTLWQRVFLANTVGLIPLAGERLGYLLLDRGYDRQQELDADQTGADYLWRSGLDPRAEIRMLEHFERDPDIRKEHGFFSTHPTERARIQKLRAHIAILGAPGTNTLNQAIEGSSP